MAKFTIKALAVAALICLVIDWGRAVDTQQQQPSGMQESLDVAKDKMSGFMKSFKQSASETYSKMQQAVKESENTKKVGSELSSFFSGALNKLKGAFSKSSSTNVDDLTKQEAIKAFDDYAQKHPK